MASCTALLVRPQPQRAALCLPLTRPSSPRSLLQARARGGEGQRRPPRVPPPPPRAPRAVHLALGPDLYRALQPGELGAWPPGGGGKHATRLSPAVHTVHRSAVWRSAPAKSAWFPAPCGCPAAAARCRWSRWVLGKRLPCPLAHDRSPIPADAAQLRCRAGRCARDARCGAGRRSLQRSFGGGRCPGGGPAADGGVAERGGVGAIAALAGAAMHGTAHTRSSHPLLLVTHGSHPWSCT